MSEQDEITLSVRSTWTMRHTHTLSTHTCLSAHPHHHLGMVPPPCMYWQKYMSPYTFVLCMTKKWIWWSLNALNISKPQRKIRKKQKYTNSPKLAWFFLGHQHNCSYRSFQCSILLNTCNSGGKRKAGIPSTWWQKDKQIGPCIELPACDNACLIATCVTPMKHVWPKLSSIVTNFWRVRYKTPHSMIERRTCRKHVGIPVFLVTDLL